MWHLMRWFSGGHGAELDDPDDSNFTDAVIPDSVPLAGGCGGFLFGIGWNTSGTMLGLPVGQQVGAGVSCSHAGVSLQRNWNFPP